MDILTLFYILVVMGCGYIIAARTIPRFICIVAYKKSLKDLNNLYFTYKDILKDDLDAEEVLTKKNLSNNIIKVGPLTYMNFENLKDVRMYILMSGEFIIEYEKILSSHYNYNLVESEDFDSCMEVLRIVRQICVEKGEKTDYRVMLE